MNWKQIAITFVASAALATSAFAANGVPGGGGAAGGGAAGGGGGAAGGGAAGGGAAGGGVTSVLPTTPPAPDVVLRESFGPGPDLIFARPQGGNGKLRAVFAGGDLSGFWLEYPGTKKNTWATTGLGGPHWEFAFATLNPFETLASPIQPLPFNGVAFSDWADGVVAFPDAVVPFAGVATKYSLSAELFPAFLEGSSIGFGLSSSSALQANLPAAGQIWIRLSQVAPFDGVQAQYDVLIGSQVIASGAVDLGGFNPVAITVDPAAGTVEVMLNGFDLGTWATDVAPSSIAIEGQGWADDVIVRTVP